jgi:hypothetical protein
MGMPIDSNYVFTYISPMPAHNRPAAKAAPLFNNQRKKQQTALPMPATGEQTGF